MKNKPSYEDALKRIEDLVSKIEDPGRPLTSITADVKEAMELIKYCKDIIKGTEDELNKIINE